MASVAQVMVLFSVFTSSSVFGLYCLFREPYGLYLQGD